MDIIYLISIKKRKFKPLSFEITPYQCISMGLSLSASRFYILELFKKYKICSVLELKTSLSTASYGINNLILKVYDA